MRSASDAHAQSRVFTPWPQRPRWCSPTKAKHTQFALGFLGPFVTAEGFENMTTTPETSLEFNAGPHYACTACAKQSSYSLAPKAALVQPNQGETLSIRTWLSRAICYYRGPRKHDDDTGENMTTTPETSLKVNAGQHCARSACA